MLLLFYFSQKNNTLYQGVISVYKSKSKGTAKAIPIGLAIGGLVSIIVTLAGSALLSYLVLSEMIGEQGIGYGSMIILLLSTILGSLIAVRTIQKQRLQVSLMSAGLYYLMLIGITALFFGGEYAGMGVTGLVVLIGGLIVAFFPGGERGKIRFRKRQYR